MIYYTKGGKYKKVGRKTKYKKKLKPRQKGLKVNVEMGVKDILG